MSYTRPSRHQAERIADDLYDEIEALEEDLAWAEDDGDTEQVAVLTEQVSKLRTQAANAWAYASGGM